jgi:hypothetical protein
VGAATAPLGVSVWRVTKDIWFVLSTEPLARAFSPRFFYCI